MKTSLFALLLLSAPALAADGYLQVPGARIFYQDSGGAGVAVVLLHAASGTSQGWEHQVPAFTAASYRVIAYDRRGWGRTVVDRASADIGTGLGDLLALMDHLAIGRFHIVATALGGFLGFDCVLSHPQRVRSLVIANSLGGVQDREMVDLGLRLRPKEFNALPADVRELGPAYRAANPAGTRRWLELEKESRPEGPRAPAQPYRNRLTLALFETIRTPVLLLTGGADLYSPPPLQNIFAAHIRHVETLVLPEAGHSAYWEHPDAFNSAVLAFLRKH